MKKIIIAPVGENLNALFVGLKEFPTEKVILITPDEKEADAEKLRRDLEKFTINVEIKKISGNIWEKVFEAISEIKKKEQGKEILINVGTGERYSQCAATCAAFVNGIKAFDVQNNETMLLPILKFSYYKILTDRKMSILSVLYEKNPVSLEELSKKTNMSLPLISYHVNGTLKSEGLKLLGLIETKEEKGRILVSLSMMGKLLVKGYIQ